MSYNEILNLNVGGTKFVTSRQTLMREPGSLLGRMFDIDSPLQPAAMLQQDGAFFLDRDPDKFKIILNYLREDELALLTKVDLINLKIEARYFQLTNLEAEINKRLDEMEVYKFRHDDVCFEVKKSYFRNVPFEAIVEFMCFNSSRKMAFDKVNNPVKASFEREINGFEIQSLPDGRKPRLSTYIRLIRNHLVFYDEYIRVNKTTINVNVCGHLFPVKISAALKDTSSPFYKCWNHEYANNALVCDDLLLDENSNFDTIYICHCKEIGCYNPVSYNDDTPDYFEKEMIIKSLQRLETCNIVIDVERKTEIEIILCQMGFLGDESILEDV